LPLQSWKYKDIKYSKRNLILFITKSTNCIIQLTNLVLILSSKYSKKTLILRAEPNTD
jgi:hypothetical protein